MLVREGEVASIGSYESVEGALRLRSLHRGVRSSHVKTPHKVEIAAMFMYIRSDLKSTRLHEVSHYTPASY
jgi:hypothetical protein